jgi:hypothetical protein
MAENSITRNSYRYGWHFPHEFVTEALAAYGLDSPDEINTLRNPLASQSNVDSEFATTDNLIELMVDLFPKIPQQEALQVIRHAFKAVRPRQARPV